MEGNICTLCPEPKFTCWKKGTNRGWATTERNPGKGEAFFLPAVDFDVCIIEAQALKIRECTTCRHQFSKAFGVPELWWKGYCRGANGHFGHETTYDDDGNTRGLNTWALFRIKLTNKYHPGYEWFKLNVFTHWSKATRQTVLIVFDLRPPTSSCIERVPTGESDPLFVVPDEQSYINPYWIYVRILEKVVTLQDAAVWSVRDIVRRTEKERDHDAEQERQASIKSKPAPDYRHLHETARHAIHVSETLALAVKAAGRILAQHDTFKADSGNAQPDAAAWRKAWQHTNGRLRFFEGMISSLLERSDSNKARLFNEIGLAFNMVSQFDSGISVDISRATQKDSEAMKTVAFLTLLFLPATFVSAIFSTSFFDFDSGSGKWLVSDMFWVFWVVAIPITAITACLWYYRQRIFPAALLASSQTHETGDGSILDLNPFNHGARGGTMSKEVFVA